MNISKKSWHYRLMAFWDDRESPRSNFTYDVKGLPPRDLCSYMQSLVWCIFWQALLVQWVVTYIGWSAYLIHAAYHHTLDAKIGFWGAVAQIEWVIGTAMLGVVLALALMLLVAYVCVSIHERIQDRTMADVSPEPSVFAAWFKGLKDKTCVMLNLVD